MEKENGYEKYSEWFDVIEGKCNEENYQGKNKWEDDCFLLDNGLHVYKQMNGATMISKIDKNDSSKNIYMFRMPDKYCQMNIGNKVARSVITYVSEKEKAEGKKDGAMINDGFTKITATNNPSVYSSTMLIKLRAILRDGLRNTKDGVGRSLYEEALELEQTLHELVDKERDKEPIQAEIETDKERKGKYYDVKFRYNSEAQVIRLADVFDKELIPNYGINSYRVNKDGKDCIAPYWAGAKETEFGRAGEICGIEKVSIPKELVADFIKRFIEVDGMVVKVGNEEIKGDFNYDDFYRIIEEQLNREQQDLEAMSNEELENLLKQINETNRAKKERMQDQDWESLSNEEFIAKLRELYGEDLIEKFQETNENVYYSSRESIVREIEDFRDWNHLSGKEFSAKLNELYGKEVLQEFEEDKKDVFFSSKAEIAAAVQDFNANREKQDLKNLSNDSDQVKTEEIKKRELIAQIRAAQEEGKELDAQLSAENVRTEDGREE